MNKLGLCSLLSYLLISCSAMESTLGYPQQPSYPNNTKGQTSAQVEREFQMLNSQYKQNTKELVEVMLGDETNSNRMALSVENASPCNMVFLISGNNVQYKIPIGAGQTRGMVLTKGRYQLSTQVCSSSYREIKFLQSNTNLKLEE